MGGSVEKGDGTDTQRDRRICELLSEASITGDDADKLTSVERALELAEDDMRSDLEIVARELRGQPPEPGDNPAQASYRVHTYCAEAGFDAEAYIRTERRRRNREKGTVPRHERVRPIVAAAAADIGIEITDVSDASDLSPGVVMVTLAGGPVERAELWRRLVAVSSSTGCWPIFAAEVDIDGTGRGDVPEQARSLDGHELLRARAARRGVDDWPPPTRSEVPRLATGLCSSRYGAAEPVLLLVPAPSAPAALAHLAWEDGGTFTASEHVAIASHFSQAYRAHVAAVTFSTIEFVVDRPPEGDLLDLATADRLAYGDTTFGATEMADPAMLRAATERDHVWGFWFD